MWHISLLGTKSELFPAAMFLYSHFSSGQQPNKSVLLTNRVSLVVAGAFWRSLWIPMSLMGEENVATEKCGVPRHGAAAASIEKENRVKNTQTPACPAYV